MQSRFQSHQSVKVSNTEHELAGEAGHALGQVDEAGLELVKFDTDPGTAQHAVAADDLTALN